MSRVASLVPSGSPGPTAAAFGFSIAGFGDWIAVGLAFFAIVRSSIAGHFMGPLSAVIAPGQYASIALAGLWVAFRCAHGVYFTGLPFLFASLPGVFATQYWQISLERWAGLILLILASGPIFKGARAAHFRDVVWRAVRYGIVLLALGSILWYVFPLPGRSRGEFGGLLSHSKLLGNFASTAFAFLFVRWLQSTGVWRTRLMFGLFICVVVAFASGARVALAAIVVSAFVTLAAAGLRKVATFVVLAALIGGAVLGALFFAAPLLTESQRVQETLSYYQQKGVRNTRQELWNYRLLEIRHRPLFGWGVGMAEEIFPAGTDRDESPSGARVQGDGDIVVEPGSGWLGMFSMTGFAGGLSFVLMLCVGSVKVLRSWRRLDHFSRTELASIGAAFTIQLVAEGFLLSVGNPAALFAWLLIGRAYDAGNYPEQISPVASHGEGRMRLYRLVPIEEATAATSEAPA